MKKLIRRKKGFTLIELLVVVLILAILMAVALPLYLSAVADSETKTCRANLQTISGAVQAYRVKNRMPDYTGAASWNLLGDLSAGRPGLGPATRLEVYRLMQFTFRDILEQDLAPDRRGQGSRCQKFGRGRGCEDLRECGFLNPTVS